MELKPPFKVLVNTPELSKKVQLQLFKLGFSWGVDPQQEPKYTDQRALFIYAKTKIMHGNEKDYYGSISAKYTPVPLYYILRYPYLNYIKDNHETT